MTRKIVFINQSTGYLTIDILNDFTSRFDEVALIYGEIRVQDAEIDPKVRKYRVTKKSRETNFKRFIRWFAASIQIFFLLLTRFRKYEIFYFSLPPFAYLGSIFLRNKFSVVIYDVYPDALKIVNISENNIIYRFWAWLNKIAFKKSHRIYTIGESLADMISQYTERSKITVIPLWTGLSNVQPIEKTKNPFIKEFGFDDKFIVQYSGNIGPTYSIESLIEVAIVLKERKDILFLIIGRGMKMPVVKALIESNHLTNCVLLPFQPDDVIRYSIAAADISVVMIDEKVAQASIPSKVYNIMAVGSSIMSIAPESSELSKLIRNFAIGDNFHKDDIKGMAEFVLRLKVSNDLRKSFSLNAMDAAKNYTAANALEYYKHY